jgi:integrase
MASVRKLPGSKYWIACYRDGNGKRRQVSTKLTDQKKAEARAWEWEEAHRHNLTGCQVCLRAIESLRQNREALEEGAAREELRKLYEEVFAVELKTRTVDAYWQAWKREKTLETKDTTLKTYLHILGDFVSELGDKAQGDLRAVTQQDVINYRNGSAEKLSVRTANNRLKMVRVFFNDAKRAGLVERNPAEDVRIIQNKAAVRERRSFTVQELRDVFAVAGGEWKGLVLFGLYTGQRLGDLARLTWANIDLERNEVKLTTGKTGRRIRLPLAAPLREYLIGRAGVDDPLAPIFPESFAKVDRGGVTGPLSKEFRRLLMAAGLAPSAATVEEEKEQERKRDRERKKARKAGDPSGRGGGRKTSRRSSGGLSFHCLRHTATSLLKNAGVSEAVAMDIIGHDSKEISLNYTHIEDEPKREALARIPDITANQ